jgi:hypothetical protein
MTGGDTHMEDGFSDSADAVEFNCQPLAAALRTVLSQGLKRRHSFALA